MQIALWLACLALVLACGNEERSTVPQAATEAPTPADSDGRLDPAPYRARIEATEALLYSSEPLTDEEWKALSAEILALHNDIVFADASASARETSARLLFLSARADAMTTSSHDEVDLGQLRELWEGLSADQFTPAAWIRAQTATP